MSLTFTIFAHFGYTGKSVETFCVLINSIGMNKIDKRYFFLSKIIRGQWLNKFIFWKMAERRKWLVHTAKNEENKNRTSLSILNSYLFSLTPAQKTCFCVHEKCLPHLCSSIMTSIPFWLHKIEKVFYVIKKHGNWYKFNVEKWRHRFDSEYDKRCVENGSNWNFIGSWRN